METFDFFIGHELLQIAVGKFQLIFNFDQDLSISVESGLQWRRGSATAEWRPTEKVVSESAPWLQTLGHGVRNLLFLKNGNLRLLFENEDELTLIKSSNGRESFQVTRGGRVWVF